MNIPPVIAEPGKRPPRLPLWWVIVVNGLSVLTAVPFYFVPVGAKLRPMGWAMWVAMLGLAGLVGAIMAFPDWRRNLRTSWFWLVVILALTPYPLALAIVHHAQHVREFILAP